MVHLTLKTAYGGAVAQAVGGQRRNTSLWFNSRKLSLRFVVKNMARKQAFSEHFYFSLPVTIQLVHYVFAQRYAISLTNQNVITTLTIRRGIILPTYLHELNKHKKGNIRINVTLRRVRVTIVFPHIIS
jgi:hypothetical protein